MLNIKVFNSQSGDFQQVTIAPETLTHQECLVGRASSCQLVLDSLDISRSHGKIKLNADRYEYIDLGSVNGSRINNQPLQSLQGYPLGVGDLVQMGDFVLLIEDIKATPSGGETSVWKKIAGEPRWVKGELTVRCVRIVNETTDVKTFTFIAEPQVKFDYLPGQFVTLSLNINGDIVDRSYSISSAPSRPHTLEITVKRVPAPDHQPDAPAGLVSNWLHDHLQVGDQVKLNGPWGKFTCGPTPAAKLLLLSAGSGITPMISMSRWIADQVIPTDVVFFHCARTPQDIIFRPELEMLAARLDNFRLALSTTRSTIGQPWFGLAGRLTEAMLQTIAPDWQERTVYVCGPDGFMQNTKSLLAGMGFPMQSYYEESFGAPKPALDPAPAAVSGTPTANATAIKVSFTQSQQEVTADGSASILELAEQAGIKIRSSCKQGVCGACKKRKVLGEVKYITEPDALDAEEQQAGYVLTCVAIPVESVAVEA